MTQSVVRSTQDLVAEAERLVPVLRERGTENERLGQLSPDTIADFEAAGFLEAMRPAETGGREIDIKSFVAITRALARGDASSGWIGGFFMTHSWMLSKFGAEAQAEIFGDRPWVLSAAVSAPPGRADRVPGGYKVTGRWRFASGIMHSEWVVLMAMGDHGPLSAVVPVSSVKIYKTWDVPGMKGTGSNDVEVTDLFVPDYRALGFAEAAAADCPGALLYDYPLLRYPMHRVLPLIHPVVALGTADAALELFRNGIGSRVRPQTGGLLIDEPTMQQTYGEAYQRVRVAELVMNNALDLIEELYGPDSSENPSMDLRAELNLAITHAGVTAFEAVDLLVRAAGAGVHRTGHPLDRICRDTQVMRNHGMLDWTYVSSVSGRALLGRGLGDHAEALF